MLGKRPPEEQVFYDAARQVLDEISRGENATANVQASQPSLKKLHWKNIAVVVDMVAREGDNAKRALLVRSLFAKHLELVVFAHWYTNLSEADRDLVARFIFESDRQTQDSNYYFGFANDFAIATVLESFLTHGWEGSEAARQQIEHAKEKFIEQCEEHCAFVMTIAKARSERRELSESEKNLGQTTIMLKEAFRRMLAGEKVLDD